MFMRAIPAVIALSLVAVVIIICGAIASACGGTASQRAVVVTTCTAATLASVRAKLPEDNRTVLAVELASEEVACVLAGLSALPAPERK